jgi:hypothetical protein
MEKDTVLLSLETYNQLRDFKENIEKGNSIEITGYGYSCYQKFITTDEAIKNLMKDKDNLQKEISELKQGEKPREITLYEIKKMSIWKFLKWRKS